MDNYDYTLIEAAVNKAVEKQTKELVNELTELTFHLREIKELMYRYNLPEKNSTSPSICPDYYQFSSINCENSSKRKQVITG